MAEFKFNKSKGIVYLQIWDGDVCFHLGNADKVLKLVRPLLERRNVVEKPTILTNFGKEKPWSDDEF